MPLNKAQIETVNFYMGPAMVLAGPGSGKTTVITQRIRNLVDVRGVNPSQILVITFTRAAADEMRHRYETLSGGRKESVTFGTFHSVFFHILRHAYHYNSSQIIKADQKRELIRQLLREESGEMDDEGELITSLLAEISSVKGNEGAVSGYSAQCCPDEMFLRVYNGYQERLRSMRMLDFDDMLLQCKQLFEKREDILNLWQRQFRFILIDEFQDINKLQYDVMRMLALPQNNLFVVGDDDQSIYRFRGARPEIMLGFPKDYPDARTLMLDINYRSTPQIVSAASSLISCNHSRYSKNLRANCETGTDIVFKVFDNLAEENFQVLRDISGYHAKGIAYDRMAILFRTNNDPRAMVETLIRMNYHFHMKDVVPNLYEHWISRDILTYMIIAAGSCERGDFLRIINRPSRYIRRTDITDRKIDLDALIVSYAGKPWIAERIVRLKKDIGLLTRMEPYAAVNYIRKGIGYEEYVREYADFRRIRPDELIEVLDELQEASKQFRSLADWLSHIRSYSEELREKRKPESFRDGIWISTMHGSKGLEYDVVFIVDANEGVTPHRRSVEPEEIEEERRLFYVAMTRAKKYLNIYSTKSRCGKDAEVSRFVSEALGEETVSRIVSGYVYGDAQPETALGRVRPGDAQPETALGRVRSGKAQPENALGRVWPGDAQPENALGRVRPGKAHGKKQHSSYRSPEYNKSPLQRGRDILNNGWHL